MSEQPQPTAASIDARQNAIGIAVERLIGPPVASYSASYALPTIERTREVPGEFEHWTPDGDDPCTTPSEDAATEALVWGTGIWPYRRKRRLPLPPTQGGGDSDETAPENDGTASAQAEALHAAPDASSSTSHDASDTTSTKSGQHIPIWRTVIWRDARGPQAPLTLRIGAIESPDGDEEYRYLRKREYGVSELPIFRPDLDDQPAGETPVDDEGTHDHGADPPATDGAFPRLSPGPPGTRDYDHIRLTLYSEAMSAWRQLTDVRFRLMSMLPAISIVAFIPLLLVVEGSNPWISLVGLVFAVLGLGLTHGLHIYEQRNDGLYNDLISRARRIEAELGVDTGVMLGRPSSPSSSVSHGRATSWVYRCVKLAWLTVALALAVATAYLFYEMASRSDEPTPDRIDVHLVLGAGP